MSTGPQDPYGEQPPPPPSSGGPVYGQQPGQQSPGQPGSQPYGASEPRSYGQPGPQSYGQQRPYPQSGASPDGSERTWMILAHLSAPIAFIVSAGTLSILGPLLIWIFFKDSSPAVRRAASGAFNFNLSFWVMYWLAWLLVVISFGLGFIVAIPIWIVIFVVALFAHIKGALRAASGESYDYPFQIKILD
jgi:uncharacterized Tic20 family protein